MNDKLIITTFTDPMMGLSYESLPVFRKLETHFRDKIIYATKMAGLVKNVYDFVDQNDLRMYGKKVALNKYQARLAMIYLQEEKIGNLPIIMNNLQLFNETHTSSLPLNRAYKAVEMIDPSKAENFLYNLRYSTVVETNQTTSVTELTKVAVNSGLDEAKFLEVYESTASKEQMNKDFNLFNLLKINTLPAYLFQYKGQALLVTSLAKYDDFLKVISQITNNEFKPQRILANTSNISDFIRKHPHISAIELIDAFDLKGTNELLKKVQPLVNKGFIKLKQVKNSYFIEKV